MIYIYSFMWNKLRLYRLRLISLIIEFESREAFVFSY